MPTMIDLPCFGALLSNRRRPGVSTSEIAHSSLLLGGINVDQAAQANAKRTNKTSASTTGRRRRRPVSP